MKSKKYYNCFSFRQKGYLLDLGFKQIGKEFDTNGKAYWIFEYTDGLRIALDAWNWYSKTVFK